MKKLIVSAFAVFGLNSAFAQTNTATPGQNGSGTHSTQQQDATNPDKTTPQNSGGNQSTYGSKHNSSSTNTNGSMNGSSTSTTTTGSKSKSNSSTTPMNSNEPK